MTDAFPNARELGIRSRAAVAAKDRDTWLSLFAEDAVVQDPIGPSPFDPEGVGHRGLKAIAAFYDDVIATSEATAFEINQSYLCGDEVAEVGIIRITLAGGTHQAIVRGVYTYRTDGAGKIASLRTFWEFDGHGDRGSRAVERSGARARPRGPLHRRRPAGPAGHPLWRLRVGALPAGRRLHLLRHRGPRADGVVGARARCGPGPP